MTTSVLVVDDNKELLALLTQLFEDAGYAVLGAGKGRTAIDLARDHAPAVAVVDMLLPDMMGFHLAEALRKNAPSLPLIFITGVFKGAKQATEAKQRFGAVGFFDKPFDAAKLLAAVKAAAPAPAKVAAPGVPVPTIDVELDVDVEDDHPQEAMELTGKIRVSGGGDISAELSGKNMTAAASGPGPVSGARPPPPPPQAFNDDVVPSAPGTGVLTDNLPALITAFHLTRETGELGLQRGKVKKVVYFQEGVPVFGMSNLAADRFGQFLVRVGKIKPEELNDVAVVASQTKRRTGDVLVERGLLKDTERLYYVGQQVKAIIYSVFSWEDGAYQLSFNGKARAEAIKLDLHPASLIVRGIKKLYKPERLARLVPDDVTLVPSQNPAYGLGEIELEKWEAELLTRIDGNRSNAELVALAKKPEHVVRAYLAALLGLGIVEKVGS